MFFRKRYLCILCNTYHDETDIAFCHKGAGVCRVCYDKIKTDGDYTFSAKEPIVAVLSPYEYDGILREAIKKYKFGGQRAFGIVMGRMLAHEIINHPYLADYDCIIPIPLHGERNASRGYNQAEILASELARGTNLELFTDALFRIKNTKQQSSLFGIDRVENVRDAFYAYDKIVKGRNVILVDDVCTRGETLASAGKALVDAGANMIIGVTLAKTSFKERIILR